MADRQSGIIKLHGREYKTVALRVSEFRAKYPIEDGWCIDTSLESDHDGGITMKATIVRHRDEDPKGCQVLAVGWAREDVKALGKRGGAALEICETSAIGRALAAAGFGGSEYASADELQNALAQQGATHQPIDNAPRSLQHQADQARKVQHHPSWTTTHQRWFMARLSEIRVSYEDVAEWCRKRGKETPSCWTLEHRRLLLTQLEDGRFPEIRRKPLLDLKR